jgi:sugar lactone lactonase YvrE
MRLQAGIIAVAMLSGCASKEAPKPSVSSDSGAAKASLAHRVGTTLGFSTPESVLWDAEQGIWFVSNINGSPSARDNNGFISRLKSDGSIDSLHFIEAGRGGVTLNGPKGLALIADTLWVTDIDAIRGFNRRTGAPVVSVPAPKAHFLNDPAVGPDGTIYFTDTGVEFDDKGQMTHPGPDRIYALKGRKVTVAAEGDWLERPNGITWDAADSRFIVVPFGGPHLLGWKPGGSKVDTLGTGPGAQDGVERLADGRVLITSWADSSVFALSGGSTSRVVSGVPSPADIGYDPARNWLAIPIFTGNRVEFWVVGGKR